MYVCVCVCGCVCVCVFVTLTRYVATLPHLLNICEHKSHATFIEDLATLAHAFHINLLLVFGCLLCGDLAQKEPREVQQPRIVVAGTQQLDSTWKVLENGSQSPLPKGTSPMEEPMKVVGSGREASKRGRMLPFLLPSWKNFRSACGRFANSCGVLVWVFLHQKSISFFSNVKKKTFCLNETTFSEF